MEYLPSAFKKFIMSGAPVPSRVVFVGEEAYFRIRGLNLLTETLFRGVDVADREIHRFDSDIDFKELALAVNSYPFFGGHSLVIVADDKLFDTRKNAAEDGLAKRLAPLAKIMEDIPDFCTVVVSVAKFDKKLKFYKEFNKNGAVCLCDGVKPALLAPWLREKALECGGSFAADGIGRIMEYLAQVDKAPLGLLEKEIEKLAATFGSTRPWTGANVEQVFSDLPELGAFKLSEAIGNRNLPLTLKYLGIEQEHSKPGRFEMILGSIKYKLRVMIRVLELQKAGVAVGKMPEILADMKGMSAWAIGRTVEELKHGFTMDRLVWAFLQLGKINGQKRELGFSDNESYARMRDVLVVLLQK